MEKREIKTSIDELEIEPLSEDALRMITGGESNIRIVPPPPCIAASCSVAACSSDEVVLPST